MKKVSIINVNLLP